MLKRKLIVILTLLSVALQSDAQKLQASLSHYSTEDGLTSNAISDIIQDDYGYLWIATWNGMSRFDGYHFFNYKTGNGSRIPLLHNRLKQLVNDQQQNIWMRMYDGRIFMLNRKTDRIVNPFEGVSGSEEYRTDIPVFLTSSGYLLVSILDVGIYMMRFDNDKFDLQLVTTTDLKVNTFAEGYHNDIWVGTDKGVHRLDLGNLSLERKGMFEDETITALFSNGFNVWAGSKQGSIYLFSYGQEPKKLRNPSGLEIHSIDVDSHGIIWFIDPRFGISRIKDGDEKLFEQRVPAPEYDGLGGHVTEAGGVVWTRMNHGGYGYYNREADEVEYFHNDPSNPWNLSNTVNAQLELPEGVVFESTSRRGLEKLEILKNNILRKRLIPNPTSNLENEIRGLYYDTRRKLLLLANKANTLFVIREDSSRTLITQDSKGNPIGRVYGIAGDSKGNYWLSSKDYGLFKMTPGANGGYSIQRYCNRPDDKWSLCSDKAYLTVEDKQGNIWVATYGGGVNVLTRDKEGKEVFLNRTNTVRRYPHNSYQKVRTIAIDKEGTVWAGTTDGVLLLSLKDGQVDVRRLANSKREPEKILMSNDIVCLACDKEGTMWLGTNGGGLSRTVGKDADGNWLFENFGSQDGLPSDEIRSVTFDSRHNVWFATDNVLCSFDTQKRIITTFSKLDGVDETICSEGSALCLPNDNVIFGTLDGYYLVDRKKLVTDNASILKLRITDFFLNDELVTPRTNDNYDYYVPDAKSVTLPSHNEHFAFRFASMNYQLQHRIHYQYKLLGVDPDWRNADKSRTAHYSSVPAGKYRFMVKAFLLESPDKYDQRVIEVIVPSHFLLSSKAIWLYMLMGTVLGLVLMFTRQQHIRRKMKNMKVLKMGPQQMAFADQRDYDFVKVQYDWLEQNYTNPDLKPDDLVAQAGMSRADYATLLKKLTDLSPKDFIVDFRLQKAMYQLEHSDNSVASIAAESGFADPVDFTRIFKQKTGVTPTQFREMRHEEDSDAPGEAPAQQPEEPKEPKTDEYEIID